MDEPPEETRAQPVEVTCPGCFHTRTWEAAAACPICKYRPQTDRSGALLPVGTQLKRYVIGEKLGQGGFGITYRGFDLKLHMKVAIKEYYPSDFVGRSTDRQTVVLNAREHEELFGYGLKTFLKEARTLAQIKHPRVVRVLNYFEMNGTAYLAMDYLEGEDLTAYLKRQPDGRLPWRRALALLLPVLDGLRKVHEAGFMHRDIKPGNLYWTDEGLVLLDFGSARQVASPHSHSLLIYSAGYAPYEQYLQGHLNRQGPWTDVYGAAATLYFMLTARRLPSALERKQNDLLRQPDLLKPVQHWVPDVPPALDAVLLRALAVELEQRQPSIVEFKQQLEAVLATAEKPVAAKKPVAEPPPRPRVSPQPSAKPTPEPPPRPRVSPQPSAKLNRWALAITVIVAAAGLA
ncbi:MAG: serine/threonine protein kinase, partial [Candidatus Contendobacter sp.]